MTDLFISLFCYHFSMILVMIFLVRHIFKLEDHDE